MCPSAQCIQRRSLRSHADIERTYGTRKPLAARVPLHAPSAFAPSNAVSSDDESEVGAAPTPSQTDGETATETDLSSEGSASSQPANVQVPAATAAKTAADARAKRATSAPSQRPRSASTLSSKHDIDNRYFQHDMLVFKNFDAFRAPDFATVLVIVYTVAFLFVIPAITARTDSAAPLITVAFVHALAWRVFHSVGLGLALKAQSERRWIVRHFIKHYLYDAQGEAVRNAFDNWKSTYNLSLCMTYLSTGMLAWQCYNIPADWEFGSILVRHVLGLVRRRRRLSG